MCSSLSTQAQTNLDFEARAKVYDARAPAAREQPQPGSQRWNPTHDAGIHARTVVPNLPVWLNQRRNLPSMMRRMLQHVRDFDRVR